MAIGDTLGRYLAAGASVPSSNYATPDVRNGHPVMEFDKDTDESLFIEDTMPRFYNGGSIEVHLWFAADGITSGNVIWQVAFEDQQTQDLDSDGFASAQSTAATAVSATDGALAEATVTLTLSQADSVAAGKPFRMKVNRDADNGSDTAAADAQLFKIELKEV